MVKPRPSSVGSVVSGTAWAFIGRLSDAVAGFLFSIIGARLMGKDVYGLVGATIGIISILGLLADMGVPNATTKFTSQYLAKKKKSHVRATVLNTVVLETVLGALAAFLCFVLAEPLANGVFGRPELAAFLRYGAPIAFFLPLLTGMGAIFSGYQRQEFFALSLASSSIIRLISSAILLSINPTVENALLGYLIGLVVANILFAVLLSVTILPGLGEKTAPRWAELKALFSYSLPVMLTYSSIMLFNWVGTLFLTAFAAKEEISWFNIAYGMVNMPVILSSSIETAFFPIVTDLHSRGKHKLLSRSYSKAVKFTSIVMLPTILILVAVGQPLILLLYGKEFVPAYGPLVVLSLWGLVRPIASISNAVSNGVGKPFLNTKANLVCLGMSLLLSMLLVPRGRPYPLDLIPLEGLMGASWAITISFIIGMSLQVYFALDASRTRLPIAAWAKALVASMVSALVIVVIVHQLYDFLMSETILMNLIFTVVLALMGFGIYMGLTKIMGTLDKSDMTIISAMPLPMKATILKVVGSLSR